ncbi:MAG: Lrp/AsnC family transcriptional regulator [Thermoplasmata archaeon]
MRKKDNKKFELSDLDKKILFSVLDLKESNLNLISKKIRISKSTVHNRIKRMKINKLIDGFIPIINLNFVQDQITAISLIKAKYGPEYAEDVGKRLAKIQGIWAVYFVLGSNDFIVLIRAKNKIELENIVNELTKTEGLERSETIMVIKILKEDFSDAYKFIIND